MDPRALAQDFTLATAGAAFVDNPYPTYAALRAHAPVQPIGAGSWLLTRYDDVLAAYRDPRLSSDKRREFAPKFGDTPLFEHHTSSLVFNDPPSHTRVRRLLLGAVNQRAIARMEPGVVALVDTLLAALAERAAGGAQVDLIEDFAAAIPVEVIGNLLSFPREDRGPLRGWSLAILAALEPAPTPAMLDTGNRAVTDFVAYLKDLIAHRRAHPLDPEEDVLTRLIQGEVGGERLSERELLHNCIFLLNAGHETTTNLIGNGLHALMTHRHAFEQLRRQPELINPAVEELLRFESPLQLNNRLATAPIALSTRVIEPGDFITLAIGAANRDPAEFAQPDALNLARKPNGHLAFGQGMHACSGMNVARLEGRIAIGRLLARYPDIRFAGAPERDQRLRFRGFRRLPVVLG
jgi:cytochrome P450